MKQVGFCLVDVTSNTKISEWLGFSLPNRIHIPGTELEVNCPTVGEQYGTALLCYKYQDDSVVFDDVSQYISSYSETFTNNSIIETPIITDFSLDFMKNYYKDVVIHKLLEITTGGWTYDFGESYGTKTLQTRPQDVTNWLTAQNMYSAAVIAGQGNTSGATIRTSDNTNIDMTFSAALNVLIAMAQWGAKCYQKSWNLKDQIDAATNNADLSNININDGWPTS